MNKKKALEQAQSWVNQKPMPQALEPAEVWSVLEGLGFALKGKNSNHTTYRWYHKYLLKNESYFQFGIVSISVGHSKGQKSVIRVDSTKKFINALIIYLESENVSRS